MKDSLPETLEVAAAGPHSPAWRSDRAEALAEELQARLADEVRFDAGSRALYATDASNYRHVPIGVVIPRTPGWSRRLTAIRRSGDPGPS